MGAGTEDGGISAGKGTQRHKTMDIAEGWCRQASTSRERNRDCLKTTSYTCKIRYYNYYNNYCFCYFNHNYYTYMTTDNATTN